MFYTIIKNIIGILFKPFYKVNVQGLENIPNDNKLVLCSNHASNLDPIFISIAFPRQVNWMAKKELFRNKVLGFLINKLGTFPVDREGTDINAIKNALRVLKEDKVLGVFPEGTRVKNYNPENAKHGAVLLSMRSKAPILPVYIESNYKKFSSVNIYIGKPIEYYKSFDKKLNTKQYDLISKDLLQTIYSLKDNGINSNLN